jgi:amino acid adenylation domain-containing protein
MEAREEQNLVGGFIETLGRRPSSPALQVDGEYLTYRDLGRRAGDIAATISEHEGELHSPLAAVLASRSFTAYAAVLGALMAGRGYVPLNPKFPAERTRAMLVRSGCDVLIAGIEGLSQLEELLSGPLRQLRVILPDAACVGPWRSRFPEHRFIASREMAEGPDMPAARRVSGAAPAYLLFTSGSRGEPKGVAVSHVNVCSYVGFATRRYGINARDRVSQFFDLTFDLSVHDMFTCWWGGACLYCVPEAHTKAPAKFIRDRQLTVWFSVPSVVALMRGLRLLRPACFPTLRHSLFCGESLSANAAHAWQEAAPNSVVENLYGPTEATIAVTGYRWDSLTSPARSLNGIVPIGQPFNGQRVCVVNPALETVGGGESGELCLSGTQVTAGYWNDSDRTRESFVRLPGQGDVVWYRTGDCVQELEDGCLLFLGRLDEQVKIRGYRAELQEIDFILRRAAQTDQAICAAWPVGDGSAEGIIAFVCDDGSRPDAARIISHCKRFLPDFMVPRKIYFIDELPLNPNGKIDRRALVSRLEATKHE